MENEKVWDLQSAKSDYENSRFKNKLSKLKTCDRCKFFRIKPAGIGQTFPWCEVKSKIVRKRYHIVPCKYFSRK
ncbi:hypothetical protein [Romboutsia ilealis]|uniref:hypothetical protein n=1 Tax=Romboutsia ilealis TaxID=1115758 RepID=UPI00272B855A|nr:hypothetical protein [Romboutsia ilealis]